MDDEPNETPADDSEKPADDQPTEQSDDKPADDQPAEQSDDKPADDQPAEQSDDKPADDQPAEQSDDKPADDQPAEQSDDKPADDQPADQSADKPADDQPAEQSDDNPADDQPAEQSDDKPADDQPVEQSDNKPAQKADDKPPAAGSDSEFRKRCMALLTKHKGRMKHVYLDTLKIPSIGIGFNLKRGGARQALESVGADYDQVVAGKQDLTDAQIDTLFNRDLDSALAGARRQVSNFDDLRFNARLVVVDMMFMGEGAFAGFKKMIAALKKLDYNTAADEMKNSQWYVQVALRGIEDVALMRDASGG